MHRFQQPVVSSNADIGERPFIRWKPVDICLLLVPQRVVGQVSLD